MSTEKKENPLVVFFGLMLGGAMVFLMLWAAFETDPQYRETPSPVTRSDGAYVIEYWDGGAWSTDKKDWKNNLNVGGYTNAYWARVRSSRIEKGK